MKIKSMLAAAAALLLTAAPAQAAVNGNTLNGTAPAAEGNMNEAMPSADTNPDASMNNGVQRTTDSADPRGVSGTSGLNPRMSNDDELTTRKGTRTDVGQGIPPHHKHHKKHNRKAKPVKSVKDENDGTKAPPVEDTAPAQ